MEVSHASTEMQAAAIGINGVAEEVTVSTDAEFMMTIAHGIYSNKALALIRELLCNARDGHAKAGCLDKPIHVTLTDNMLVVRDHGTGIPNAIFARTYMTFGKSTKRQEKGATGGFGVGTKVPWAVCDVFSGRNYIDGTMTAYSIVKSDPNMEGKPTCTPVMSIPSTEPSGVEVSVPFPEKMHQEIRQYLLHFVNELGIPVVFNGQPQKFSDEFNAKELREVGYTRLPHHPKTVIQHSTFYVRQGDVIYPIECQEEFEDAFTLLNHLNHGAGAPILFMAEPDSIIPTLSRESLQYTDRTSKSIRDLMKKALQTLADNVDSYAERTEKSFPTFLSERSSFLSEKWKQSFDIPSHLQAAHREFLTDKSLSATQNFMLMQNMSRWLMARTPYIESLKTTGKDFREKIHEIVQGLFKEKLATYAYYDHGKLLEIWEQNGKDSYRRDATYLRKLKRNLYEELMYWRAEARFNTEIAEVYFTKRSEFYEGGSGRQLDYYFTAVQELKDVDTKKEDLLANTSGFMSETMYVSRTVVISGNPVQMVARAMEKYSNQPENWNIFTHRLGRLAGARYVRVRSTTKASTIEEMRKAYVRDGYEVIILMDPTKAEIAEREAAALERAKLKDIPLPTLDTLIRDNLSSWPTSVTSKRKKQLKHLVDNPAFKGKPMYFILPRGKELPYGLKSIEDYVRLIKFVGTDIVCVSTKGEIAKVLKEGRQPVEDLMVECAKWFYRTPGIHNKLFNKGTFFVKRARQNRYLTRYLFNRVPPELTTKEEQTLTDLREMAQLFPQLAVYLRGRDNYYADCNSSVQHYQRIFQQYAQENFCDVSRALEMAYARKPSRQRAVARSILKTILKERPA